MAGNDSFDPHSWTKKAPGKSDLPEAWAQVSRQTESKDGGNTQNIAAPAAASILLSWVPHIASTGLLFAGGFAAWAMSADQPVQFADRRNDVPILAPFQPSEIISSRRLVIAKPSDLADALRSAGISDEEITNVQTAALQALGSGTGDIRAILTLKSENGITVLMRLEASYSDGAGAIVSRQANGQLLASRVAAELSKQIKVVSGELDSDSFYSSAVTAGVTDSLIPSFVNAFAFDFDLQQEVAPGDTFEVAFEQTVNASGEAVGQPELLFARLTTQIKSRSLYRFRPVGQDVGWYDGNGASTVRTLMRTPVDGARISSKFGWRIHPVLGYSKLHGGTDFAAPTGTPIYASGDAVATWVGMKGANGNLVILKHDNGWLTYYLHLSRFGEGMAVGARVHQGQKIGEVGTTGRSTGPHLHYEVHVDGQKLDPLSIKTDSGKKALEGALKSTFIQQRDRVDVARARQQI